jgi:hypothetical protein
VKYTTRLLTEYLLAVTLNLQSPLASTGEDKSTDAPAEGAKKNYLKVMHKRDNTSSLCTNAKIRFSGRGLSNCR